VKWMMGLNEEGMGVRENVYNLLISHSCSILCCTNAKLVPLRLKRSISALDRDVAVPHT